MSNSSPLISIIMPVYNCEKYLDESITTVINQSYEQWELILINDGSTDSSGLIAKEWAARDMRIKVIYQENGRQGKARNNGIRNALGNFIAFLDSDDLWPENKLELQLQIIEKEKVDLVFSDGYICLNNDMSLRKFMFQTLQGFLSGKDALNYFYRKNQIPISTVLCRKDALFTAGLFEEAPGSKVQGGEDYAVWVKMLQKGLSFYGMQELLLYYRVHSDSTNSDQENQQIKGIEVVYNFSESVPAPAKLQLLERYTALFQILNKKKQLDKADDLVNKLCKKVIFFPLSTLLLVLWKKNKKLFFKTFYSYSFRTLKSK